MARVLVVDDEPQLRRILLMMLIKHGFEVAEAESGEEAIALRPEFHPDVALLDISLKGIDGIATLQELLNQDKNLCCIMMTAYGTIPSAVQAMQLGAFHYLTKPFDNSELMLIIDRALKLRHLSTEVEELRGELSARYGFNEIVGISPKLQSVFRTIMKVAPVDATVLIEGESGTGKELVARAVHRRGLRAQGPFVAVNCGAIPHSLFEAEFFGYERGAFTDASQARAGRFEQAQGGSIFLDEISEMPLDTQVKLLRALQDREVSRLGGRHPIKLDLRVIAATNADLKSAVEKGRFREDLYYRLNVVKIMLPSLRERREDIPLITDYLLERFKRELGLKVNHITSEAQQILSAYDWPGNVRELENIICSAMILCEGNVISARDLPRRIRGEVEEAPVPNAVSASQSRDNSKLPLSEMVKEATEKIETMIITTQLAEMKGNRTATAESLGISRKSLFNKMRQYGLGDENTET